MSPKPRTPRPRRTSGRPDAAPQRGSRSAAPQRATRSAAPQRGTRAAPASDPRSDRPARRGASRPTGLGGDQVEGRRAVRELLAAGRREVREVWIADGLDPSEQIDEIERLARRAHVRVIPVPRGRLAAAARTDAPQGVLAFARELSPTGLDDLCGSSRSGAPFLVVADGITDPANLGAILRSAECAGVTGLVVPRHRATRVTAAVAKVAAGAVEHVPMALVGGIPAALARLEELEVTSIGLDAEAPTSVHDLGDLLRGPVALVVGAEGRGLSSLTRKRCSVLVSIPRRGRLGSLNAAAAATVACFEVARQRAAR